MSIPEIIVAIFVVTWAAIGFGFVLDLKTAQRITRMEDKMGFIIGICGKRMMSILHSPHTPELDRLIDRFTEDTLSESEVDRLLKMLSEIEHDQNEAKGTRAIALLEQIAVSRKYNRPVPVIDTDLIK